MPACDVQTLCAPACPTPFNSISQQRIALMLFLHQTFSLSSVDPVPDPTQVLEQFECCLGSATLRAQQAATICDRLLFEDCQDHAWKCLKPDEVERVILYYLCQILNTQTIE